MIPDLLSLIPVETVIASILLAISTNIDNLAVGVAYGVRRVKIGWQANSAIAFLSGASTFLAMTFGDWLENFLANNFAQKLGSSILILIGFLTVANLLIRKFSSGFSETTDLTANTVLKLPDALLLGLALTITNLGTGIGAGLAQLDPILTSILSFLSSLLTRAC
ncbi:MAG: manganese efflux pump [Jaaginema sp. PMC 1079.18]|nr:manganese efflux pump [Jaaginema sp. PMC 1080.18]MEC4852886.1 manganese efflux pump [Jaaginema sp. PMC 1079.18]MEC4868235.1 manganese efflux pump [Jaaginema sp. PMC 1078.18]